MNKINTVYLNTDRINTVRLMLTLSNSEYAGICGERVGVVAIDVIEGAVVQRVKELAGDLVTTEAAFLAAPSLPL